MGARLASTNQALEYRILKVDVHVRAGLDIPLDEKVLEVSPNAFALVPTTTQTQLRTEGGQHRAIASRAFQYWISVLRWVTGDFRIGQDAVSDHRSGWSTYFHDAVTGRQVWGTQETIVVAGSHCVTATEWAAVGDHMTRGTTAPLHATLRLEAEQFAAYKDYRRAIIDLAIACETFLRKTVLDRQPVDLAANIKKFVEDGNINQFATHFFPSMLSEKDEADYKKTIRPELSSLFSRRNDIMHSGNATGATPDNFHRYNEVAKRLFELKPSGTAQMGDAACG